MLKSQAILTIRYFLGQALSFAAAGLAAVGIQQIARLFQGIAPKVEVGIAAVFLFGVVFEVFGVVGRLGMPTSQPQYAPLYYEDNPGLAAIERVSNAGPRVDRFIAEPTDLIPPNAGDIKPVLGVLGHRATMLVSEFDYIARGGWGPGASDASGFPGAGCRMCAPLRPGGREREMR